MAKKNNKKAEPWQIGGAAIGAAVGAVLGFLTSLFFSSNITTWLKERGLTERYKYLIGTFIILLSMPIPSAIGYIGGEDINTIVSNVGYFFILYFLLIFLFEDLSLPGIMDSIILGGLFILCFCTSMKFGLKTDGTLSWFWVPMIVLFSFLLAVQYYFADIVKLIGNMEKRWENPEPTVDDSLNKDTGKNKDIDADNLENPSSPWLTPDFKKDDEIAKKILTVINSQTHSELNSKVKTGEHVIDSTIFKVRPIVPIVIIVIAGLSLIITLFVSVFIKKKSEPDFNILFQSGLLISIFLFIFFCVFLFLGKFGVEYIFPQLKAENLEPIADKIVKTGNLTALNTLIPIEVVQRGGSGKISSHKPRKSKTDEKYLRVSF
jgi:hypothetical protein